VRWALVAGKGSDEDLAAQQGVEWRRQPSRALGLGQAEKTRRTGEGKKKAANVNAGEQFLRGYWASLSLSLSFLCCVHVHSSVVMGLMLKWAFKARDGHGKHGIREQHGNWTCSGPPDFGLPVQLSFAVSCLGLIHLLLLLEDESFFFSPESVPQARIFFFSNTHEICVSLH
jgi:hypothetical protein